MQRTEAGFLRVPLFLVREALFHQVITIPNVFVTREAEEMIGDATAGCGELDLVGTAHTEMLAAESWSSQFAHPKSSKWSMQRHALLQFLEAGSNDSHARDMAGSRSAPRVPLELNC
jgi:hypothetical protein